jgi:hypothetical protein
VPFVSAISLLTERLKKTVREWLCTEIGTGTPPARTLKAKAGCKDKCRIENAGCA